MEATTETRKAPTFFAPGERHTRDALKPLVKSVMEDPIVLAILRAIPGSVLIVNKERQIVAANKEILEALKLSESDSIVGMRPGEALGCVHAAEGPSGCGTSRHCKVCGAVIAMLAALDTNEPYKGECTLTILSGERVHCLNFAVHALPIEIMGERCLEIIFHDISDRKMREAFDRVFLHDLRNAVAGLYGWSELLSMKGGNGEAANVLRLSRQVVEMIEHQSALVHAEAGDLAPRVGETTPAQILDELKGWVETSAFARRGTLELKLPEDMRSAPICTDRAILNRVLVNMVKNGFEAIKEGEAVTVSARREPDGRITFSVHNPGLIPEDDQLRIFQRSFSTKGGGGRGFGTYSIKLLGQNVLRGAVGFESTAYGGTRFYITLPRLGEE